MKKILGIVGSPRKKGNTHLLVEKILDGAQTMGAQTELIFLSEMQIKECDGCHACWKGKKCSKKDDMQDIYPKIMESDVLVFGTPVYWYGPTGIMKCFVDRFVYFNCPENRKKIRNKSAVLVVPFEERKYSTSELLIKFFEKSLEYLEIRLIAKILVPGVTKRGEVVKKKAKMEECFKLGRRIARTKESARQLAHLGGTEKSLRAIPRRTPSRS